MLALALIQAGAVPFPWKEILGLLVVGSAVVLILIRHGLRKPPQLATVDEVSNLRTDFARLEGEVKSWQATAKAECASRDDLNKLGEKVARVDAFHLSLNDNTIKAMGRAGRALREVAGLKEDLGELRDSMTRLAEKIEDVPETMGRIDERLQFLIDRDRAPDRRNQ